VGTAALNFEVYIAEVNEVVFSVVTVVDFVLDSVDDVARVRL
jgi:hypothetical protein